MLWAESAPPGLTLLSRHFTCWHFSSNWGRTGMPVYKYTHIISNMHGSAQIPLCMVRCNITTRAGTATSMAESAIGRNGHIITQSWLNRP